jgi:hypothetical protein
MRSRLTWCLSAVARLVLLVTLALFLLAALLRVFDFRQPADFGEGTLLATVERMEREPISAHWLDGPEYTVNPYGPVYYWTVRAVRAVLPWQHSLLPGRLVSLAATLGIVVLLGFLVGRHTKSLDLALLSVMLLLASPVVHAWATPHRVDPLAVLLAFGGYLTVKLPRRGIVVSACLIVVASLTKQNMALAGVPIFLLLLFEGKFKAATGYAILVVGLGVSVWATLDLASGGYYMATAIRGHLGAMWPQQGFEILYWFLTTPLGLSAGIVLGWMIVKSPASLCHSVYGLGLITSLLFSAVLSCKEGASYAYHFESSVLAAAVLGLEGLPVLLAMHRQRALLLAAVLAGILAAPEARELRHRGFRFYTSPYASSFLSSRLSHSRPTYVLADGQYLDAVLQEGLTPLINDPFLFRQLVGNGTLKSDKVIEAMEQGKVEYLVLKRTIAMHRKHVGSISQKWPAELLDAMDRGYALEAATEDIFLYRRRTEAP